jgi:uncharacterized protein YlxP (DUF503 family)
VGRATRPVEDAPSMSVAVIQARLLVPGCATLKEKRSVVRSLVERLRGRFPASVAEVGSLDLLQRADLGAAIVSNDPRHAAAEAEALLRHIEGCPDVSLLERQVEIL